MPEPTSSAGAAPAATAAVALVTGSSRGLGRGIAEALAAAGLSVVVHYRRDRAAAEVTAASCSALARTPAQWFPIVQGDIARSADRQRLVDEAVAALGRIDALVSNAGVASTERADVLSASEGAFDDLLATNLKAPHFLAQIVARRWLADPTESLLPAGRKIVFVSSVSAVAASIDRSEYCIAKAGLAMVAKLWALRLAKSGIGVYELRPGIMRTDMTAPHRDKYDRLIPAVVPQARWGTPADVGQATAALLRGQFPFSTGAVIPIDGGFHLERL